MSTCSQLLFQKQLCCIKSEIKRQEDGDSLGLNRVKLANACNLFVIKQCSKLTKIPNLLQICCCLHSIQFYKCRTKSQQHLPQYRRYTEKTPTIRRDPVGKQLVTVGSKNSPLRGRNLRRGVRVQPEPQGIKIPSQIVPQLLSSGNYFVDH